MLMEVNSNILIDEAELIKLGYDVGKLKGDLTLPNYEYANMMRFGKGRFHKKIDPYICYLKKQGGKYIVPRYYFGETGIYGNSGKDIYAKFKFSLRDYQRTFWDLHFDNIKDNTGILIEAACGTGKTIMGIYLSLFRAKQTMVLVPTYYLAKQWKQRIEEATDATCVILTAKDTEIPTDRDFTIIVMDLFICRHLPKELIENTGHIILDEAHRVGAETYLPILEEIPAKYRTALTATFRRNDGVHKILAYHFGKHIHMESHFPRPSIYGIPTKIKVRSVISKNKKYENFLSFMDANGFDYTETKNAIEFESSKLMDIAEKQYNRLGMSKSNYHEIAACIKRGLNMSYSVVESYLSEHSGRRKIIISVIQKCLKSGRTVLFLSKRKDVLKSLHEYFSEYRPMLIISETNKRSSEDDKYLQEECRLVLGVTQLAKEGLDIDRLDTLIIHLPMVDTEQAIGRISRLYAGKKNAVALYLVDDCPMTYAVYTKAKKFFKINAEYKGDINLYALDEILNR